jgi:DNA-binding NarL/FixJ family response regulator
VGVTVALRVLLCDDTELVRVAVRRVLEDETDMVIVAEADSLASALVETARTAPDIVVLDAHLPDGNGVDAVDELRAAAPGTRIIVLSGDEANVDAAAEAGADGYVVKQFRGLALVEAIREVAAGRRFGL